MAKTSPGPTRTAAGEQHLHRAIGLPGLTMINVGGIIGSGWLLGALTVAKVAGGGSLISWIMGAAVLAVLALVHAELGSTYPVSGGTARFPFLTFGALGGFTGGWMSWLYNVTVAPIEAEASLSYLDSHFTGLHFINSSGLLTPRGIVAGAGFLLVFVVINAMGVKWLSDTNAVAVIWKVLIPVLTIVALMTTRFHASNFTAGGGFAPYGFHGIFAALPLGVIFAEAGFEMCIQVGGEAKNPQKNIPRAIILSLIICTLIYLLLEVTFVGALNPAHLLHGWANPIGGVQNFGPYATLATAAGLGWLTTLLLIDAVISPAGAGLVYHHRPAGRGVGPALAGRPAHPVLARTLQRLAPHGVRRDPDGHQPPPELVGPGRHRRVQPGDLLLGRAQHPAPPARQRGRGATCGYRWSGSRC